LIEDVSADVAPTVQEFIAEAAAANKEENAGDCGGAGVGGRGVGDAGGGRDGGRGEEGGREVAPYIRLRM
jgi:hypothetical protein